MFCFNYSRNTHTAKKYPCINYSVFVCMCVSNFVVSLSSGSHYTHQILTNNIASVSLSYTGAQYEKKTVAAHFFFLLL